MGMIIVVGRAGLSVLGLMYFRYDLYSESVNVKLLKKLMLPEPAYSVCLGVVGVGACQVSFSLILLTLDRFVNIVLPFKYRVVDENRKIIQKMIVATWCITTGVSLVSLKGSLSNILNYFLIVQTYVTILFIIISYTAIGVSIRIVHIYI